MSPVLLLLMFAQPTVVLSASKGIGQDLLSWQHFKFLFGGGLSSVDAPVPQPVQVISAGLPRTGSYSFVTALQRLDYKPYHMSHGVMSAPGHLEMWHDYVMRSDRSGFPAILDAIARDGYNVTTDIPINYHYKEVLAHYPSALVVLTEAKSGEAWASSMLRTVAKSRLHPLLGWFQTSRMLIVLLQSSFVALGLPTDPGTGYLIEDVPAMVSAYDAYNEAVKQAVPKEQLLVFRATHGWKPLCDFLSPSNMAVAAACEEVLASGEPYPQTNDSATVSRVVSIIIYSNYIALFLLPFAFVCCTMCTLKRCAAHKEKPA
eukprot:NODE_7041_length_1614_cov_10.048420.p1 GENE.NODE_7041_length_1614_cov_10.048420~~NODE_7041_length_1614_cov_10.048420.p1  ORF type:complete len:317 (+),score=55.53 NODE_7041_length_1614_cov_10.048420:274-1224(+)